MSKRVIKCADRVDVALGGPYYAKGAKLSLLGTKGGPHYLRAEIPMPPPPTAMRSVCAWCQERSMRAFILEAARRLGYEVRVAKRSRP